MLKISDEDVKFLKKHIENADELIADGDRKKLLRALSEVINYKGFDKDWCYNDFGKEAQMVYDRIYDDNQ